VSGHIVSLFVGGEYLDTWDGYSVTLDMLSPGSAWTFGLWRVGENGQTRTTWAQATRLARVGERVTLAIDGVVVLDGTVEERDQRHQRSGAQLIISGRDLAGAAIDAHADPSISLRDVTLQAAIERLAQTVSLSVELGDQVDPTQLSRGTRPPRRPRRRTPSQRRALVDRFRPRIGETVWQCMEALCRRAGYLLWTAPGATADRLVLRIDAPRESGTPRFGFLCAVETDDTGREYVTQGSNVLEGSYAVDASGVPTSVTVYSDSPRGETLAARDARTVDNDQISGALFSAITPLRPRFMHSARATSPARARREAARAIGDANARLRSYTCTVQGHAQTINGVSYLYQPNEIAVVRDDIAGADFMGLITRVEFMGSRGEGTRTRLRIVPLGAVKAEPSEE
jgi:prophage tail gpP-like protein